MGILSIIKNQKSKFKNYQSAKMVIARRAEIERLQKEQKISAELAKVNAEKQRLQRDVQGVQEYNKKQTATYKGANKVRRFAQGAARVMGKTENYLREIQNKNNGPFTSMRAADEPYKPAAPSPFSQSNTGSPFAGSQKIKPEKPKDKTITVKIQQ